MRVCERRCQACGNLADGAPSAHFARVVWLCEVHSAEFHGAFFETLRSLPNSAAVNDAIDAWLRARAARAARHECA